MKTFRSIAVLLVMPTVAATAAAVAVPAAAVAAPSSHHRRHFVSVVGDGSHVSVGNDVLHAGRVTFAVRSTSGGGSSISLFRPRPGHTLAQVFADLQEEFTPVPAVAAKGTRDLVRDVTTYGLAQVSPARGALVTRTLRPGTYYLMDLGTPPTSGPPATTQLTVLSHGGYHSRVAPAHVSATVRVTSADRFKVNGSMPAHGTVLFHNVSNTIHFMMLQRVKPGTTDRQVQQYFNSGSQNPPPWGLQSPEMGSDVLTPGQSLRLTYRLHPGTYVLLCFVADDQTGMPHAFMGMHKVVRLH